MGSRAIAGGALLISMCICIVARRRRKTSRRFRHKKQKARSGAKTNDMAMEMLVRHDYAEIGIGHDDGYGNSSTADGSIDDLLYPHAVDVGGYSNDKAQGYKSYDELNDTVNDLQLEPPPSSPSTSGPQKPTAAIGGVTITSSSTDHDTAVIGGVTTSSSSTDPIGMLMEEPIHGTAETNIDQASSGAVRIACPPLGITFDGGPDMGDGVGLYVKKIKPGSNAAKTGRVEVGQRFITVDGVSCANKNKREVTAMIKAVTRGHVMIELETDVPGYNNMLQAANIFKKKLLDAGAGAANANANAYADIDLRQEWLHKNIDQEDAVKLAAGKEDGTFLVRTYREKHAYVLTVLYKGKPTHHKVVCEPDNPAHVTSVKQRLQDPLCVGISETIAYLRTKVSFWPVPLTAHIPPSDGGGGSSSASKPQQAAAPTADRNQALVKGRGPDKAGGDDAPDIDSMGRRELLVLLRAKKVEYRDARGLDDLKALARKAMAPAGALTRAKDWEIAPLADGAFAALAWKLPTSADIPPFGRGHPSPNRYKDILPTPSTRYELKELGGDIATTYINANWVKGDAGWPKVNFIAAQGPTPKTVPSFVRMIWESGCETVVMTTNLIEGAKVKCARYWPDTGDQTFSYDSGPTITLRAGSKSNHNGYIKQELTMSCGGTERTFVHFWYNTWPDHGVPTDKTTGELNCTHILEMLGDVRRYGKTCVNQDAPIIVHCSAGIGRTGTYMGIDICSKMLWQQGCVDIVEVVDRMRDDRGGLVQHKQQLHFLHEALREYTETFLDGTVDENLSLGDADSTTPNTPLQPHGNARPSAKKGGQNWLPAGGAQSNEDKGTPLPLYLHRLCVCVILTNDVWASLKTPQNRNH